MKRLLFSFFILIIALSQIQSQKISLLHSLSQRLSQSLSQKKLVAFSSDASKNDKQQIFIMDEDGDEVRQVCYLNLDCISPEFSPDGRKIVFGASNKISDYLYMVDLDDTATFHFPVFIDGGTDPHFSPDGKLIIYRSERDEYNAVYIIDLASGQQFPISDGSLSTHAEFSRDGSRVVYSSSLTQNFDLAVLNLNDTTDDAQQTIAATKDAELFGTFSPDGLKIAFASFDINYRGTLKVCDNKGKNVKVVSLGGSSYNPKFSPDGKYLAYISNKTGNFEIYICNSDGTGAKQLTTEKGDTEEFEWLSDSKRIVFDNRGDGVSSIWIVNIENGDRQNLTGDKANNITPTVQR
jgi:Tol biopolymer transport system component